MTTRKKSILCLIIGLAACLIMAFIPLFMNMTAKASTTTPFTFTEGASIRISSDTASNGNKADGIRFKVNVDSSIWQKDEIGMIIVPNQILEEFDKSGSDDYIKWISDTYGKDKSAFTTTVTPETLSKTSGEFSGAIVGIYNSNFNKEYGAVAYYLDGETYHYTRNNTTRRIAQVANNALVNEEYTGNRAGCANVVEHAIELAKNGATAIDGTVTVNVSLTTGKTIDLGQVVTDNYISANKNTINWAVTGKEGIVKLGFLDNIQGVTAGSTTVTGTAYSGMLDDENALTINALTIKVNVTVSDAQTVEDVVDYVVEIPKGEDIRVLQLTDIQIADATQDNVNQFGTEEIGSKYLYKPEHMEDNVFKYMRKAVNDANPHLIILTGDNVYGIFDDKGTSFTALVEVMDSFGIPWAIVYGNHDNESAKGALWQNEQLKNSKYCLFNQGVADGNGNYSIGLKQNEKIVRVCYLMDSNYCGAASNPTENNIIKTRGFTENQMAWFVGSVSKIKGFNPNLPVSMYYHVPDVNFANAQQKYLDKTSGAKYYTIGANVKGENGDFGANLAENGEIGAVETIDPYYNEESLLEIYQEYGIDSVFVGHKHSQSMSILHEGIRWTFGLKTGVYDHISVDMMGGTLATIGADGAISVKHLYYDDNYAAQMEKLQDDAVNGMETLIGLPLMGENSEIIRTNSQQKTYPVSVEYVADAAGNSSVAYRFKSHTIYIQDSHFKIDLSKFSDATSVKFDILVKDGEFTKEMGGTRSDEIVDGRYVVSGSGSNSVLGLSIGNIGTYWLNEKDVDNFGSRKLYYEVGKWSTIDAPLVDGDKTATSFTFMVSTASTIYLKNITPVDFSFDEVGQTLEHYVGDTRTLTTTGTGLTFTSDNDSVVSVDSSGKITCHTTGTATITVTGKYGYSETVTVTVDEAAQPANYAINYYVQSINGVYVKDDVASKVEQGMPGTEIVVDVLAREGYDVNTEKSTKDFSGYIKDDGSLVIDIYYDLSDVTINSYGSSNRALRQGTEGTTADGYYTYTNKYGTYTVNADGTAQFTHKFVGDPASSGSIKLLNATANRYLLLTVKYNDYVTLDDNATKAVPQIKLFNGVEYNYPESKVVRDYYSYDTATSKFIKLPGTANDEYVGKYITFVAFIEETFVNSSNAYYYSPAYERNVDMELVSYSYLTTEQAKKYFDLADYTVKHYELDSNNNITEIANSAEILTGFIGTSITATAKSGYTLNESLSSKTGTILADDSLVLNMIYGENNGIAITDDHSSTWDDDNPKIMRITGTTINDATFSNVIYNGKVATKIENNSSAYKSYGFIKMPNGVVSVTFSFYIPTEAKITGDSYPMFISVDADSADGYRCLWRTSAQKAAGGDYADTRKGVSQWIEYECGRWETVTIDLTGKTKFNINIQPNTIYLSNVVINYAN